MRRGWRHLLLTFIGGWCCLTSLTQAAPATEWPLFLYASPTTASALQQQGKRYEPLLEPWRRYLQKAGVPMQEASRAQLLAGLPRGVLIVPSAQALDNDERKAIQAYAAAGHSVLGTGLMGVHDAYGMGVGTAFLQALFKVQVRGFFSEGDDWFLMPFGDGPISWGLPAGRRISLGHVSAQSVLRLESEHLGGVIMNWSRERDPEPIGATAFHEDGGRRVYFAFPESNWGFHKPVEFNRLLDNAIAWLRHEPQAYKAAWPHGYQAAHLIEMDTEDKFASAPNLAAHLESIGARGTFYCLTSEAVKNPDVVRDLLKRGHDIAYHADVHFGFRNMPIGEQDLRIQFMLQQMGTILGDQLPVATGFRAPTESYDRATEQVLRRRGLKHHAADPSATPDRLPFFSRAEARLGPNEALVVLPRTQMDDVDFTSFKLTPEQVLTILLYDLDLTVRGGGLGLLSVHSQNYIDGGLMRIAMADYMPRVAEYKSVLWVARGNDIAQWWRLRAPVEMESHRDGKTLHITVRSPQPVPGLSVMVTHMQRGGVPKLRDAPRKAQAEIKPVDDYRSALVIQALPAGQSEYEVRLP